MIQHKTKTLQIECLSLFIHHTMAIQCTHTTNQGQPGFGGIQYIGVFTVFLCLQLGIKYSFTTNFGYKVYRVFLNFGILHKF